jgi:hypothetical protein
MRARLTARSWACDIQPLYSLTRHEMPCLAHGFLERNDRSIDDEVRASQPLTELDRARRAPARLTEGDDQCPVAILDVLLRALNISCAAERGERITCGDDSVFRRAAGGTPAAARHAEFQCRIERAAINARLTAGNHAEGWLHGRLTRVK